MSIALAWLYFGCGMLFELALDSHVWVFTWGDDPTWKIRLLVLFTWPYELYLAATDDNE
jgi:hypothetical protein